MTREEAKKTLLLYRPGTADAQEPEMAEALAWARQDVELARWLEQHSAEQEAIRARFRQVAPPSGLKEQIISERVLHTRQKVRRRAITVAAATAFFILAACFAVAFWPRPPNDDTFANYRSRMVSAALRGYSMDLASGSAAQIRAYLEGHHAGGNYELPQGLQKTIPTGCAIERWQGAPVAMLCFGSGRSLPPGQKNDLWLFVVDASAVKNAPNDTAPQLAKVNKLITATWRQGDKLYLLGTFGDENAIRPYL